MIYLKLHTEATLLIDALAYYQGYQTRAFKILCEMWEEENDLLDVHPDLSEEDIAGFTSLMNAVEEPRWVPFTTDDLWYVHGVFYDYLTQVLEPCTISKDIEHVLSEAVGSLGCPPY